MFLADFHVHTTFSDGRLSLSQVIDFYGQRDFGCIAITDHICETSTFLGKAASALKLSLTNYNFKHYIAQIDAEALNAKKKYNMVVIPGFELTKNSVSFYKSAHILGLGVRKFVSANESVINLTSQIRSAGGLTVAAHPVSTKKKEAQTYYLWENKEEFIPHFDAWEVASGSEFSQEVSESGLPLLATSDFHKARDINSWKTLLDCKRSESDILLAIKAQDVAFRFYQDPSCELSSPKSLGPHQFCET